jgi:hypothetical protein
MYPNAKGSELLSIIATIDPVSQAAGTVTTGWLSVANFHALMAVLGTGVLGAAGTVDAKLQQALDAIGTGVKDIPGRAIVQFTQVGGGSGKQAIINLKPEDLDVANGYGFVRLSITVGVAASLVSAQVIGLNPRYADADVFNQAAVTQIIY